MNLGKNKAGRLNGLGITLSVNLVWISLSIGLTELMRIEKLKRQIDTYQEAKRINMGNNPRCSHCNKIVQIDDNFCGNCGTVTNGMEFAY